MPIPESQLTTWSAQGSKVQSASTYQIIRNALNDAQSPFYHRDFEIFLQGSYGNDTNVYADSDVDVVIALKSVYYSDTNNLNAVEKANYEVARSPAEYSIDQFKKEVTDWLRVKFSNTVKAGKKAITVPGNGSRRDADVLACALHRTFYTYPLLGSPSYNEGVMFVTADGERIINYPKQHSTNCTNKHQATGSYFKPTVRILKNMRNRMRDDGRIEDGLAPSYFLEGLLSNVPNHHFRNDYASTITGAINHIQQTDKSQWTCANGIHYLLRDGHSVCWSPAKCSSFMNSLITFWNEW